jgi:hypothetical protein
MLTLFVQVSSDASVVVPGASLIILAVPAFQQQTYLEAIKPFLTDGVVVGAMPGLGGFDIALRQVFGSEVQRCGAIFALSTLPWSCRIRSYAEEVDVLGTKLSAEMFVWPREREESVRQELQSLLGPNPKLILTPSPLSTTLMNIKY